ncbi:MAG TPA: glycine--tRNA ligase subunit beta [Xanthomonadales bacterium]|nr:glycine--tRNA ligase subunit beta [Xanthomonadales bacterium]
MSDESVADLLIELGCEELPPRAVDHLRKAFFNGISDGLSKAQIDFDRENSRQFSTPRRLAVQLASVADKQKDQELERRGPAVAAAFNDAGEPTPAATGFARSVGLEVEELERLKTDKGEWLYSKQFVKGASLDDLLFEIIENALRTLPIPRPMRWSDHEYSFVRPVHWVVVMHGDRVPEGRVLGKNAGNITFAHRIHAPGPHRLKTANDYKKTLLDGWVVADPKERKRLIVESLKHKNPDVIIDEGLLNEVNNLVEWPVAVECQFDEEFLEVPHPALISTMQDHQKFFPVGAPGATESESSIANRFVAISNIESKDVQQVRTGYERVVRPRLADSRFFLEQDSRKALADYIPLLDDVVFQKKIGTIGEKTKRITEISEKLADFMSLDSTASIRAAALCKCDLMTQMVGEFPELQGVMGAHYALASGETDLVATAIGEHYAPKFAGDQIPISDAGRVVSLADRTDTLVSIFSAGMAPTGNKDPFALRRAALGLIRILAEAHITVALSRLLEWAAHGLRNVDACDSTVLPEVEAFIVQRARGYFLDQGYGPELIGAVLASPWKHVPDLEARLSALRTFMGRDEAESLATANKRIGNILRKSNLESFEGTREELLVIDEEKALFDEFRSISKKIKPFIESSDYPASLEHMAGLKQPLDQFFENVMVMDEDKGLRDNRLALLAELKALFDEIADLSVLA